MKIQLPQRTVLVLTGPTGVGKTDVAMDIAREVPVEIVSADSRQIYRYMDIGTAKPSQQMRKEVPHHFIDILDPNEDYSAGRYGKTARRTIGEIFRRGKTPLVVGGSGLYIRALLEGFFGQDVRDPAIRQQLQQRAEREGREALYAELKGVDPLSARKIHPHNLRRVIRTLEVYYTAGKPISALQKAHTDRAPFPWLKIGLTMERKQLYVSINRRVETMLQRGLVEEVQTILEKGFSPKLNALNSVGYKEIIAYLNDEMDLFTTKELIKQNSRRYAKRQYTWFRSETDIYWMGFDYQRDSADLARTILSRFATLSFE